MLKGNLPEDVFSEILEVDWPAMWSFSDSFYRLPKRALEVICCNHAAVSIPT